MSGLKSRASRGGFVVVRRSVFVGGDFLFEVFYGCEGVF